ncbi:MAG TPA: hypothetical protein VEK31_12130 [Xanthobacteraceae bacterium]|nr:hypothetical protein [Xanthobacteraceae bacterium]
MSARSHERMSMNVCRARNILLLGALLPAVLAPAGCTKKDQPQIAADANAFPANYRKDITTFLRQSLTNRADFHGAMISEPAMRPIGDSQHYIVCIQFNPKSTIKTKAVVFLGGQMTQFIDSTPEQCADAVYQPFKELDAATPAA